MKLFRKKSFSKSLSARLSAAPKRKLKKALIPGYGQKGMGWLHPRKKLYNKVYNSTTIDPVKLFKSGRKNSTVKTIRRDGRYVKMEERSEKKKQEKAEYSKVLNKFKNNDAKKFENYYFDLKDNQILEIQNVFSKKYRIIDFKDVLSYSINKKEHNDSKTETKRKHGIGRAVVGGVLLGPVGAAVGGLTSKKETQTISKDFVDHLGVVVNLNDGTSFEIEYFDTTLKADDSLVTGCIKQVNQLATVLEAGIENAKRKQSETVAIEPSKAEENNEQPVQSSPATDPLDEIKKLKGLLDIGAITQEEFDAKKKQLLDL